MAIKGRPKGGFSGSFEKELTRARRAAANEIGPIVRKARIDGLIARNAERIGGGIRSAQKFNAARRSINKGGKISPRRKKAVRTITGRDGLLVLLDHYPYAQEHEDGVTLTPKSGKFLFIGDKRRRSRDGDKTFVTKGGAIMAVKKQSRLTEDVGGKRVRKKGARRRKSAEPRLIGVLKKKVVIKPMKTEWRLDQIGARHLEAYRDAIERNLTEGGAR